MVAAPAAATDSQQSANSRPVVEERSKDGQNEERKRNRRPRKRTSRKAKESHARLKIVIRRLPPNLPVDSFKNTVEKWLPDTDWWTYVPGKLASSQAKINVFSRAYMNFKTVETLLDFCAQYNAHTFVDSRGSEYRAVVEFAPYQKTPKKKRKLDPRMNTIDQDPDYLAFLKSLEAEDDAATNGVSNELQNGDKDANMGTSAMTGVVGGPNSPKTTPLLEALRIKKAAQRAAAEEQRKLRAEAKAQAGDSKKNEKRRGAKPVEVKGGGRGKRNEVVKNVTPTGIIKRPSPPSSPQGKRPAAAPNMNPKEVVPKGRESREPRRERERANPTGNLFKASLGAALGIQEPRKPRERKPKSKPEIVQVKPEEVARPLPTNSDIIGKVREEGKGRSYKSKRLARAEAIASGQVIKEDIPIAWESQEPPPAKSRRNRVRNASESSSQTTAQTSPQSSPARKAGPSVTIMKRDGTTSSFNVGVDGT
ncbi:Smg-4/UPF3 family-domain-containing protein [Phlyctochytrium arcticum]|nr:Smg-4/UPF3 family-domain-containing protein [Phlyctochytrium arcticum]